MVISFLLGVTQSLALCPDFGDHRPLTRDMEELWVAIELDGVLVGDRERIKNEAWALFSAKTKSFVKLSDYSDLETAVSNIGATETSLYIDQDETLTDDLVIPENIRMIVMKGNTISDGGNTLNVDGNVEASSGAFFSTGMIKINGSIIAGEYQIFSGFGTIDLSDFSGVTLTSWFNNDLSKTAAASPVHIHIPANTTCTISRTVDCTNIMEISGEGISSVIQSEITDGSNLIEYSSDTKNRYLHHFRIVGNSRDGQQDGDAVHILPGDTWNTRQVYIDNLWIEEIGGHSIALIGSLQLDLTESTCIYEVEIKKCYIINPAIKNMSYAA